MTAAALKARAVRDWSVIVRGERLGNAGDGEALTREDMARSAPSNNRRAPTLSPSVAECHIGDDVRPVFLAKGTA
jgi:hypothetical protein